MRRTLTAFTVVLQVLVLFFLASGTSSAQPDLLDPGIIDLPGSDPAPDTLALSGTIRDFKASHPDFEEALGVDPNIVTPTIGPDRKPVYASATTTPTTSGKANFDQWYRDVPDVNLATEHTVVLDRVADADPPIYRYANESFFPIDGQLWGNEGRPHNYWFTYELHSSFTYQGGEEFGFTGDDDVWVFINDQRVIDLGGVHGPMSASVDLDEVAEQLGLVEGETYSFDRHTSQSSFTVETSLVLEPPQDEKPPPPPCKKP
jgi:fibro-slime domain-containing protein